MVELCPDCGESFGSPADLVTHMKAVHGGGDAEASMDMNPASHEPGLECALCGRWFPTKEALAAHNLQPHPAARPSRPPMEAQV